MPIGTQVTWTAAATGASTGTLMYRFRIQAAGADFRTVVDYGPNASLTWTTIAQEGAYQIEAAVFNSDTLEEAVEAIRIASNPTATSMKIFIHP